MGLPARPAKCLDRACDLPLSCHASVQGQTGCMQAAAAELVRRITPLLCGSMLAMLPHLRTKHPASCEELT